MTTLTPSQRLEAYRWAKENFENNSIGPYLCNVLMKWCNKNKITEHCDYIKGCFPEFEKMEPRNKYGDVWFNRDNSISRHQVLDKCISEVEKLIKKETV